MDDPNIDLAQQLLASEELENERMDPWWKGSSLERDSTELVHSLRHPALLPKPITVPASMIRPIPSGQPLYYNMCAIWCAKRLSKKYVASNTSGLSASHIHTQLTTSPYLLFLISR
jgi:hypothetical protein